MSVHMSPKTLTRDKEVGGGEGGGKKKLSLMSVRAMCFMTSKKYEGSLLMVTHSPPLHSIPNWLLLAAN